MRRVIRAIDATTYTAFAASVKRLPEDIRGYLVEAVKDLKNDPQPKRLRLEKLKGNNKPPIYTIHITPNHSHKLSFELSGDVAVLRRVDTHKVIDRKP